MNININNFIDSELFSIFKDNIKVIMIRRRFTLGFMEFIRGRYRLDNPVSITQLFKQMTQEEIDLIKNENFDFLWRLLWYPTNPDASFDKSWEYNSSEHQFNIIKDPNNETNIDKITKGLQLQWTEPEWGLPKGKRNNNEDEIKCAIREFYEETNIDTEKYVLLNNLPKLEENLIGTNGKKYKHIYYLAIMTSNIELEITTESQRHEIGGIGMFNYDEVMKLVRMYHIDRRNIMTTVITSVINTLIRIYYNDSSGQLDN